IFLNETLPIRATSLSLSLLQLLVVPGIISLSTPAASALTAAKHGESSQASQPTLPRAEKTSPEARALADKILAALGGYDNFKEFNDLPCRARGKIVQTSSISSVVNTFDCDILVKREKQKIT